MAADPLAAIVDAVYVGRCGAVETAGMGIAISAQYSIAKLYNDPLLKTSTSIVANKSGDDLSASVSTAIVTAIIIGILQSLGFVLFGGQILGLMGVSKYAEMRKPALKFLLWRSLGIPAYTVLLVTNGIFRGRGDTKTPLYCTTFGNLVNILLDPILIFGCHMGAAGTYFLLTYTPFVTIQLLIHSRTHLPNTLSDDFSFSTYPLRCRSSDSHQSMGRSDSLTLSTQQIYSIQFITTKGVSEPSSAVIRYGW